MEDNELAEDIDPISEYLDELLADSWIDEDLNILSEAF